MNDTLKEFLELIGERCSRLQVHTDAKDITIFVLVKDQPATVPAPFVKVSREFLSNTADGVASREVIQEIKTQIERLEKVTRPPAG